MSSSCSASSESVMTGKLPLITELPSATSVMPMRRRRGSRKRRRGRSRRKRRGLRRSLMERMKIIRRKFRRNSIKGRNKMRELALRLAKRTNPLKINDYLRFILLVEPFYHTSIL
jgi:hypothetical protein